MSHGRLLDYGTPTASMHDRTRQLSPKKEPNSNVGCPWLNPAPPGRTNFWVHLVSSLAFRVGIC